MFFVLGIIFILIAVAAFLFNRFARIDGERINGKIGVFSGIGALILAAVFLFFSSFYSQDVGEARVIKDWTGNVSGSNVSAGGAFKAPWQDAVSFDIRNQQSTYIGNASNDYNGKKPNGPQITVQDKDGVQANFDIAVRYSVRSESVINIYSQYQSQENFQNRLIDQDIRSAVRNAPSKYSTLEVLTERANIEKAIFEDLKNRWEKQGVQVESVALQEIRYPDDVKQRFADAQNARTEVSKREADLAAAKVTAQQKVVEAQATADANNIVAKSLSPEVLQSQQLDTLKQLGEKGNVVVVPNGSSPLITVDKK